MERTLYLIVTDYLCTRCQHSWRECYTILRGPNGELGGTPTLHEAQQMTVSAKRFRLAAAPACWRCSPPPSGPEIDIFHDPPFPREAKPY